MEPREQNGGAVPEARGGHALGNLALNPKPAKHPPQSSIQLSELLIAGDREGEALESSADEGSPLLSRSPAGAAAKGETPAVDTDEEDELAVLRREQEGAKLGPLRQLVAYCLKRPHVVGLAALLLVLLVPVLTRFLWAGGDEYLECDPDTSVTLAPDILDTLTLREKIGQMVVADLQDLANGSDVTRYLLGAVVSRPGDGTPAGRWPFDWRKTAMNLQARALRTPKQIPLLFGADALHGHAQVHGATVFPHQIGLGATHNPELVQLIGLAVARELRATGVRWALSPCLAPCRDPRWGGCYEAYGEDERLIRMMGSAIDGFAGQDKGSGWSGIEQDDNFVVATGLGFMGIGGTEGGITGGSMVEEDKLFRNHFQRPFFDALSELGTGSVNGELIHNSSYLFGILKKQLGYRGVVMSAYRGIEEILGDWATQVRTAINRGIDLFMVGPANYAAFIAAVRSEVAAGGIDVSRIDDAVRRILKLKKEAGLFRDPCGDHGQELEVVGCQEHRDLARRAVRESLVLLKNGGGDKGVLLPLPRDGVRVLVTGSHAHNMGYQCGGHTLGLQGGGGAITPGVTFLDGIKAAVRGKSHILHERQPNDNFDADFAVIVVGERPYAGAEGDRANSSQGLKLDKPSRILISSVCGRVPCALIVVTGRPLLLEPILPLVNALVVAWLPGSQGGSGLADLLFDGGPHDFLGTLPVTWFRAVSQLPLTYLDEKGKPLFPYGFGLTLNGSILTGAFHSEH